MTPKSR